MSDRSFGDQLIDYRKHLDVIILSRTAIFTTANALMLFVFKLDSPGNAMLVGSFAFGVIGCVLWLAVGVRTRGSMRRLTGLLVAYEERRAARATEPSLDTGPYLYHRALRRRGSLRFVSATFVLCYVLPLFFLAAWTTLLVIALT